MNIVGKSELINKESDDRSRWPVEARICEQIWNLTAKLIASGLMQDYLDNKLSLDDIDLILQERDHHILKDIINLKQECCVFKQIQICEDEPSYNSYFKTISDLGMELAKSEWWARYEAITGTMGVTCVLSIRTAESLFKRDPAAPKILKLLGDLTKCKI